MKQMLFSLVLIGSMGTWAAGFICNNQDADSNEKYEELSLTKEGELYDLVYKTKDNWSSPLVQQFTIGGMNCKFSDKDGRFAYCLNAEGSAASLIQSQKTDVTQLKLSPMGTSSTIKQNYWDVSITSNLVEGGKTHLRFLKNQCNEIGSENPKPEAKTHPKQEM